MGISIEKNGKFVTGNDIQQYLGAVAHVVVIGKENKDFLHIHPTSNEKYPIHGKHVLRKQEFTECGYSSSLTENTYSRFYSRCNRGYRSNRKPTTRPQWASALINKPTHRQAHYAFWQPHKANKMRKELAFSQPEKKFPSPLFIFLADTQPNRQRTTNSHSH